MSTRKKRSQSEKPGKLLVFGSDTYRAGAMERINDAYLLKQQRRYVLSAYAAGCAVEGMLRALIAGQSVEFDERHDLHRFATRVRDLGLLASRQDTLVDDVQGIARLWHNLFRYADERKLEDYYRTIGEVKKRRTLSFVVNEYWEECSRVIKRCEILWQRSRKRA